MLKKLFALVALVIPFISRTNCQPICGRSEDLSNNSLTDENQERAPLNAALHDFSDQSEPPFLELGITGRVPKVKRSGRLKRTSNVLVVQDIKKPKKSSDALIVRNIVRMIRDREQFSKKVVGLDFWPRILRDRYEEKGGLYGSITSSFWTQSRSPIMIEYLARWVDDHQESWNGLPSRISVFSSPKKLFGKDLLRFRVFEDFQSNYCHKSYVVYPPGQSEAVKIDLLYNLRESGLQPFTSLAWQSKRCQSLWNEINGIQALTVPKDFIKIPGKSTQGRVVKDMLVIVLSTQYDKNESEDCWTEIELKTIEGKNNRPNDSRQISTVLPGSIGYGKVNFQISISTYWNKKKSIAAAKSRAIV